MLAEDLRSRKFEAFEEYMEECDVISSEPLVDWLLLNYKNYGIQIEFITDKSSDVCLFKN